MTEKKPIEVEVAVEVDLDSLIDSDELVVKGKKYLCPYCYTAFPSSVPPGTYRCYANGWVKALELEFVVPEGL